MTAESALEFEALETQAAQLMAMFTAAGYERVAPAIIQPANIFLDRIGEALRARTYVFTDPNGEELCLRPDLTVPVCRIFLERANGAREAKFCYNGPAFRVQEGRPDPLRPREFRQAGIEYFGSADTAADAEVMRLILDAVRSAGVDRFIIRLGHIGAFSSLLSAIPMPGRWRERLSRIFWRPNDFSQELKALSAIREKAYIGGEKSSFPPDATEKSLLAYLDERKIPFIGLRRPSEVLKRLKDKAADASEPPLASRYAQLIEDYLHIRGSIPAALKAIEALFSKSDLKLESQIAEIEALFGALKTAAGEAPIHFAADFGRHFEYYTGMVFQVEIEGEGVAGQIAGGGRYDCLIRALAGGKSDVPAVGGAIHTERLLAARSRR